MNHKAIPHSSAFSPAIRPTPHQPNRSRKDALRRSHKTFTAAIRKFRAFRAWEEAWLAAQLALDQIPPHGRQP
jgi:hypothetical protein